jgi:KDO2-lipid IV(A) lauroyltransferase
MHANYRRVLPGASRGEVRRVARQSLVNYCRYLADFVRFPRLGPGAAVALVDGHAEFESLDRVLEDGRGAVIVCMHFGNWDLGAAVTAAKGYRPMVVAESFADPRLDAMVLGARERLGMRVVKMKKVGPSLLRALKQNGLVALLIDQPRDGDGVRVRFFGGEIAVPAGPARIALRSGAKVIPTAFARVEPGKPNVVTLCDFGVELPDSGNREHDIQALTQAIVASHEAFIRRYPDQWYMFRPMFVASGGKVAA